MMTVTLETRHSFNVGEGVRTVTFSPNGALLAFGQFNGDIQWHSPESGEYLSTFDAHLLGISDLPYPVQSQYLVSGSDDGTVRVWLPSALLVPGTTELSLQIYGGPQTGLPVLTSIPFSSLWQQEVIKPFRLEFRDWKTCPEY